MVSVLLPLGQNFQYFFESVMPVLMARVNPHFPDGPPILEPTRQCSIMACPQYSLDDVMAVIWATDCTMSSAFYDLSWNTSVFYTAAQRAHAAVVIEALAQRRLATVEFRRLRVER